MSIYFASAYKREVNKLTEQVEELEAKVSIYQDYQGDTDQLLLFK